MSLFKGLDRIAGQTTHTISDDSISDYSVTFADDSASTYSGIDACVKAMTTGSQISKLFSAIKAALSKINIKITNFTNSITNLTSKMDNVESELSYYTIVGQSSNGTEISENPWFKVAEVSISTSYADADLTMYVRSTYHKFPADGILRVHVRTGSEACSDSARCYWITRSGFNLSDFVVAYNTNTSPTKAELWCKNTDSYCGIQFNVLSYGTRTYKTRNETWVFTQPGLTKGGYDSITSGYTQLVSQDYDSFTYIKGETFTHSSTAAKTAIIVGGLLTSSNKEIAFTIPLPKRIPSGCTVTLNTFKANIRVPSATYLGTNGANTAYVTGGTDFLSNSTSYTVNYCDNCPFATISIFMNTSYTTGNIPLAVEISTLKMTFN